MSETSRSYNEIDDYIAAFSDEERQEYAAAETALDLASMLYRIRQEQGLTQRNAAERTGLKQQAISRLEKAASNIQPGTLQRYLGALGYHIEISVIDNRTGNVAGKSSLAHPLAGTNALWLPVIYGEPAVSLCSDRQYLSYPRNVSSCTSCFLTPGSLTDRPSVARPGSELWSALR